MRDIATALTPTASSGHAHGSVASPLRRLCFGSNPIGDAGCEAIARALMESDRLLPRRLASEDSNTSPLPGGLCILQLGDTAIGDVGAAALAKALAAGGMPQGQQLWLASTRITETGRALIMAARVQTTHTAPRDQLRICW